MNREIKFRLRVNNRVVGYEKWYGGEEKEESSVSAKPQWLYSKDGKYWNPEYIYHNRKDQFTGLLDKNGKEIWEGDILRNTKSKEIFEVWWDIEMASFGGIDRAKEKIGGVEYGPTLFPLSGKLEVVGNIYENPELLKNGSN